MSAYREWRYDEYRQVGKDYGQPEVVEAYDESHAQFRDVEAENLRLIRKLGLAKHARIADFGCGTGAFALAAAKVCASVLAIDVSEAMLSHARKRAQVSGVSNVEFRRNGYLDFDVEAASLDAITSSFSLHHLPDFWKAQALANLHRSLKPGGVFFLRDVVFPDVGELAVVNAFVEEQTRLGGDFLREDALGHFREEFSTQSWIMKGLLERAGFQIEEEEREHPIVTTYFCRKPK